MDERGDVLQSWKEISNYMGRGVRTVQRWERDFGLPIRRPAGHLKGSVMALKLEVDEWVKHCKAREISEREKRSNSGVTNGAASAPTKDNVVRSGLTKFREHVRIMQEHCDRLAAEAQSLSDHLEVMAELAQRLCERRATQTTQMSADASPIKQTTA